jgi:hypothetical protein
VEIADGLENQTSVRDLCGETQTRWMKFRAKAVLETVDNSLSKKVRPSDVRGLINTLRIRKACGLNGISRRSLVNVPQSWK